jgi:DNA-3-methyladenine glycosylase
MQMGGCAECFKIKIGKKWLVLVKNMKFSSQNKILLQKESLIQKSALEAAPYLLGKIIETRNENQQTSGIIIEAEAYCGITDRACHAYGNRRTPRTEAMYMEGGHVYIYLCYGMYDLLNIVVNEKDVPEAVLIRAIYPYVGLDLILKRRKANRWNRNLLNGPGKVTRALNIGREMNASKLGEYINLYDVGINFNPKDIMTGPRIGVDYAGEDAKLPYRFWVELSILERQLERINKSPFK